MLVFNASHLKTFLSMSECFVSAVRVLMSLCCCSRCEDMVDVRRLKMLQMVQLFKCEEDAAQVWKYL